MAFAICILSHLLKTSNPTSTVQLYLGFSRSFSLEHLLIGVDGRDVHDKEGAQRLFDGSYLATNILVN